jgi:hypothetical protein
MTKGKYYTPEFKEQAVKMAAGLDCTYDLLEHENDLIAAPVLATGHPPAAQFLG